MEHKDYKAMIAMQETQRDNAWRFVLQAMLASGNTWQSLPESVKRTTGLHMSIGVCSGMLVTRVGANGSQDFVNRMNSKRSI